MFRQIKLLFIGALILASTQIAIAANGVKAVQERLMELGYQPGVADGIWGRNTESALKKFLVDNGVSFDGTLDANEFELLKIPNAISAVALLAPESATSESDSVASNLPEPIKRVPNAATLNLLSLGFNQPQISPEQWAVFSTDVPQAAKDRYFSTMEAVKSSYGGYMNWNFFAFNKDGSDTVNAPVIQRWSELHPDYAAENTVTTATLIDATGCLNGSSTGAIGTSDYELHSICYQMTLDYLIPDTSIDPYFESNDILVAGLFQHEYFHHYQRAHMLDVGLDEVPRWWIEGAAMANEYWWLRSNWMNIEFLKDNPGNRWNTVEKEIDNHILHVSNRSFWRYSQRIQESPPYFDSFGNEEEGLPDCSGWLLDENTDMDNGPICDRMISTQAPLYFMAHKSSWQAVLRDIPSDYYEYGFWGAVEKHTGLTEQQFYDEFNATMRSVDWSTIDSDFAPDGWNIPDEAIETAVDFLKISPFALTVLTD